MVKSILNGVAIVAVHWVEIHDPTVVESDHHLDQQVHVTAGCTQVQMHVMDCAEAQREDPALGVVLDWLGVQKKTDLKALLANHASSEEGRLILWNHQNFTIYQGPYICARSPGVGLKIYYYFVVPKGSQGHCLEWMP